MDTKNTTPAVHGHVAAGFENVREAFRANFIEHGELGAAFAVYRDGRPIIDLWGGVADVRTGAAWAADTVALVFSTTKGATAACVHLLAERGELDLDAPVARYWPEFAEGAKAEIPVRWLLSHRAGVANVEGELTLEQVLAWGPVVAAIARQTPNWTPGSRHGYHARSFGWTLGEIVRRVSGRTIGRFFSDEIARPLGLDFWIGLPESIEPRCAALVPPDAIDDGEGGGKSFTDLFEPDALISKVLGGPSGLFAYDEMWNTRAIHAAEMPSSNGIGDARSLARFYASLIGEVDGRRTLSEQTVRAACELQSSGPDAVVLIDTTFGSGFALPPFLPTGVGPSSFGHFGSGGSVAFADPGERIAVAYVMNRMKMGLTGDARLGGLIEALYASLAGR